VLGTVNLLEALRCASHDVAAVVSVTSDKCYVNRDRDWGYRENDELGGLAPYSSAKACQELVVASYRGSVMGGDLGIAIARAGNVIGSGDWAEASSCPRCNAGGRGGAHGDRPKPQ
jgi:CDP-glucose 4,6-dehydratase